MEEDIGWKDGREMKLWLLTQNQNRNYDTYDSAIVAAESEDDAIRICPASSNVWTEEGKLALIRSNGEIEIDRWPTWAVDLRAVNAEYIGEAREDMERGVVIASFNAG